jgi:hypothetical protein
MLIAPIYTVLFWLIGGRRDQPTGLGADPRTAGARVVWDVPRGID